MNKSGLLTARRAEALVSPVACTLFHEAGALIDPSVLVEQAIAHFLEAALLFSGLLLRR